MSNMKWSEANPDADGSGGGAIKNHSVTHHRGYLYCFGGYDGRRNHQRLLVYSLREQRWITPSNGGGGGGGGGNNNDGAGGRAHFTVRGVAPPGRNGHTATLATCSSRSRRRRRDLMINDDDGDRADDVRVPDPPDVVAEDPPPDARALAERALRQFGANPSREAVERSLREWAGGARPPREVVERAMEDLANAIDAMDAELEANNHQGRGENSGGGDEDEEDGVNANVDDGNAQGGDDVPINRHINPNEVMEEETNNNNNNQMEEDQELDVEDDEDAQIIIIGGWLGSGPLAASDMWVLDISGGMDRLRWFQPPTLGTPPGPCNMHSADFIPTRGEVYVFRGGNGREYLNDLHALDVETYTWRAVETHGTPPQQRANHSSALLDDSSNGGKSELFIFGGWNGNERLNDVHVLDTATSTWSTPRVLGAKPNPRAGMTLTALRGRLYLFGGSGTSSKCFDDLQVLDRKEMAWLDVNDEETMHGSSGGHFNFGANYYDNSWEAVGGVANNNQRERSTSSSWEMVGGQQDGMAAGGDDGGIKFADWRAYAGSAGGQPMCSSANPNDEDMVPSVYVSGKPPGRRAGHTATAVGRHIYVFGGSCGTDYLNDFFVLDTDPPPLMKITEPPSPQLYASRLRHFCNDEEFSDVTFLVEGQKVYGHKLVLSTVSDCFRAMFMTGFRESGSDKTEIEIPNCSYSSFLTMMEYIYTGRRPHIDIFSSDGMDRAIALLELADQFFLYNLKQIIEGILQPAVSGETYTFLRQVAQKTNASQLESYCQYFERNMNELLE